MRDRIADPDVKLKCKKAKNDTTSRQFYTVPYRYLIFCKLLHPKSRKSHPKIVLLQDLYPEPYKMMQYVPV